METCRQCCSKRLLAASNVFAIGHFAYFSIFNENTFYHDCKVLRDYKFDSVVLKKF
jgi:hypothetical protein